MEVLILMLKILLGLWIASLAVGFIVSIIIYGTMLYKYFKHFK